MQPIQFTDSKGHIVLVQEGELPETILLGQLQLDQGKARELAEVLFHWVEYQIFPWETEFYLFSCRGRTREGWVELPYQPIAKTAKQAMFHVRAQYGRIYQNYSVTKERPYIRHLPERESNVED